MMEGVKRRGAMEDKDKVPMLLEFLFGEFPQGCGINFETVWRGASPRLMRWGEAFDEWMAEQGRRCKPCWAACGVD
jgi:hypothetical protein